MFMAHFWSLFPTSGAKNFFLENLTLSRTTSLGFQHHAKIQKELMMQFHKNTPTDGRTDRRTDRPYFIGPFRLLPGVQKCTLSHLLILITMLQIWQIMGWLKIQTLKYLENGTYIFDEIETFLPAPQPTHFEKLSFCSRGNL